MDNYSMNDYSLNDITLVYKKYYSELKRKAKAWEELKGLLMEEYPQLIRMWESTHGEGEHAEYCKANEILERMDKLDGTHEFSNLLHDMNRSGK